MLFKIKVDSRICFPENQCLIANQSLQSLLKTVGKL
jgi:hypothetical protein